jgi:hypothetical protein
MRGRYRREIKDKNEERRNKRHAEKISIFRNANLSWLVNNKQKQCNLFSAMKSLDKKKTTGTSVP